MRFLPFTSAQGRFTVFGRATAVVAVVLLGTLAYLGFAPQLHERLHADAHHEDHECVVTTYAAGEALTVVAVIDPRPQIVAWGLAWVAPIAVPAQSAAHRLPPPCGPPAFA